MKNLLLLICVLLSGCMSIVSYNTVIPFPDTSAMSIEIHQLKGGNHNILGTADIQGNKCIIHLRKYPHCLAHEVRHCFEGNWHQGEDNDEWCNY